MTYITGDKELIKKLSSLKKTDAKAAVRKGTRAACKQLLPSIQAPVGKSGLLAQSLKVRALPRSRRWTGTRVTLGFTGPTFYGGMVEWGTKPRYTKTGKYLGRIQARNFMGKAAKSQGNSVVETAMQIIADEIVQRMKV